MSSLGDRIKRYEESSHHTLVRRMPVVIRVDGKAFHTLTRLCEKPFDSSFIQAMANAAADTAYSMQGFKLAYVQSDEANFVITDYDRHETQGWFDYDLAKLVSITAAEMTAHFNRYFRERTGPGVFDARAFNVPAHDVLNALLWRAKDWERNSLQMYCRAHFSHKDLKGKKRADMHQMLHEIGLNWATDLKSIEKNGAWITQYGALITNIGPNYAQIESEFGHLFVSPT